MEHNIQLFEHEEFGSVRVVIIDGEPWFVAADVCRILELGNPSQAVSRLDDDEKRKITESRVVVDPHLNIGSDSREINVINEPGLYRLIFSSRKPEAKNFQRWVYHEVLPSIRKTGAYHLTNADGFNALAQAISELAAVEREKLALEREKFVSANSNETKIFARHSCSENWRLRPATKDMCARSWFVRPPISSRAMTSSKRFLTKKAKTPFYVNERH